MSSENPLTAAPEPPDEPIRESNAAVQHEAWAQARRQQIRVAGILALLLALLTSYFCALNAYVLYRSIPLPYMLELRSPVASDPGKSYAASLSWEPMRPGVKEPVRPLLYLGDREMPTDGGVVPVQHADGGGHGSQLRVVVPTAATTGEHQGRITFQRTVASDALPSDVSIPVRVHVSGGFWSSWFVLRDWLLMLVALVGLMYVFCLLIFPAPSGSMLVLVSKAGQVRTHRIRLQLRKMAWLLPWQRSVVPLSEICRRVGIGAKVRGELLFVGPTLPVLFLGRGGQFDGLGRRRGDELPLDAVMDEPFAPCGRIDTMYESNTYRLANPSGSDALFLRFTSRTRIGV